MPVKEIPSGSTSASSEQVNPPKRKYSLFQSAQDYVAKWWESFSTSEVTRELGKTKNETPYSYDREEEKTSSTSDDPMDMNSTDNNNNRKGNNSQVSIGELVVVNVNSPLEFFSSASAFFQSNPNYVPSMSSQTQDLAKIGEGSFSIVKHEKYKGTELAVKYFKYENLSKEQIDNIYQEIQMLKEMNHGNIVRYLGIKHIQPKVNSLPFGIVMEFCNRNLHSVIHGNENITSTNELNILTQIAKGIEYVHSKKIVHRDIKPKNILVRANGTIAIADFGVSKYVLVGECRETTSTGDVFYTPPECLADDKFSFKTDVWSFGVVMWELLTRQVPFKGISVLSFGAKLGSKKVKLQLPTEMAGKRPELNLLMDDCLSFEDDKRPSFPEILKRLEIIKRLENYN